MTQARLRSGCEFRTWCYGSMGTHRAASGTARDSDGLWDFSTGTLQRPAVYTERPYLNAQKTVAGEQSLRRDGWGSSQPPAADVDSGLADDHAPRHSGMQRAVVRVRAGGVESTRKPLIRIENR